MTVAPQMHSAESAPLRLRVVGPGRPCEAWLRRDARDDVGGRQSARPFSTVIPLKSGTHASLRLRLIASESQPAEMWVLGTSPRMTGVWPLEGTSL